MSVWQDIAGVASTISTVVAALSICFAIWKYNKNSQDKMKIRWQQSVVHKMLATHHQQSFSIEELKQSYRTEGIAYGGGRLSADDLSEDVLRQILIDLCSRRVVAQVGDDQYQANTVSDGYRTTSDDFGLQLQELLRSFVVPMQSMFQVDMGGRKLLAAAYKLIGDNEFKYTPLELATLLHRSAEVSSDDAEVFINRLVNEGVFVCNGERKVGLKASTNSPPRVVSKVKK